MYASLPADIRERHPYHMYDEIRAQLKVMERSLDLAAEHGREAAQVVARARRVFVTGCGTSLHAAQAGAWFLRLFSRGRIEARAVEAYELATYFPGLRPDDVIVAVTHSGGTTMTVQALERGRRSGCETIAITGFPQSEAGRIAGHVLPTGYAEEHSWAHTASYTAALATMAAVANTLAEGEERLDLQPLPEVMREALQIEEMAHRVAASVIVAERYREPADLVLVGGGPNIPTAREGVLKLLETSYVRASSFELEQMLHGPLAAVTPDTLLMVIAPSGRSVERAAELMRAARAIGTAPIAIVDEDSAEVFDEAHRLVLPVVPEVISPISSVVPLQIFAYYLAVGKSINPDLLHRDDERYRAARGQYR